MRFARQNTLPAGPVAAVVVVVAMAATMLLLGATPAAAQTTVAKVAVANPAKIFNDIQETKDLKAKMENERKTLEAAELEKRTKLRDLQAQRDALKPDSADYARLNKDLLQATIEFEVWGRMQQADVQRQQKMQMKSLFEKIALAVGQVATQRGIDLVIAEHKPEFPENLDQINVDQLRMLINQRNVLFSGATVDISNEVIAAMDKKYKTGQ
jgi:Skp family chaperone for outer membrane proteins